MKRMQQKLDHKTQLKNRLESGVVHSSLKKTIYPGERSVKALLIHNPSQGRYIQTHQSTAHNNLNQINYQHLHICIDKLS